MTETVDIPAIGGVDKRVVVGVAVVVGGGVGYMYYRSAKKAPTDTATVAPESTGTFGADIGSGTGGYYGTGSAASNTTVDDPSGNPVITTNAQWAQAAGEYLVNIGRDPGVTFDALGKYLGGSALDPAEKAIVMTARGIKGPPPVDLPIVSATPAPSPSAPNPVGTTPTIYPALTRGVTKPTSIAISWTTIPNAVSYELARDGGPTVAVNGTSYTVTGLHAGTTYGFRVRGVGADGSKGPWNNKSYRYATTKK